MKLQASTLILLVFMGPLSMAAQCTGILSQTFMSVGGLDKTDRIFSSWTVGQSFSESARGADVYPKLYYGFQQPITVVRSTGNTCKNVTATKETNLSRLNLQVFPNPVQSTLQITLDNSQNEKLTARLFDNLGRQILTMFIEDSHFEFNVEHLSPGVYLLRVQDSKAAAQTFKIVKN
jgi:hypothetical protein